MLPFTHKRFGRVWCSGAGAVVRLWTSHHQLRRSFWRIQMAGTSCTGLMFDAVENTWSGCAESCSGTTHLLLLEANVQRRPLTPSKPRDLVWSASVDAHTHCHQQFEEQVMLILPHHGRTSQRRNQGTALVLTSISAGGAKTRKTGRRSSGTTKHITLRNRRAHTHNRRGVQQCPEWQSGTC